MTEMAPHGLRKSPSVTTLPLAGAQPAIWFAELSAPAGAGLYWVAQYSTLHGTVALSVLSDAIRTATAEADTLHARFNADADPVEQSWPATRTAADMPKPIIVDLRCEADPEAAAHDYMRSALSGLHDITTASDRTSYSHVLLRIADNRVLWFQRHHHLCVDGYSIATLTRRIIKLYRSAIDDLPDGGSPFISFAEVVAENRAYQQHNDFKQDRHWWFENLNAPHKTPSLSSRQDNLPAPVNIGTCRAAVCLPPGFTESLSDRQQANPAETLIAAIFIYMHRFALAQAGEAPENAATIALGMPFMRRMGSCSIDSSGPMVSVLPILLSLSGADTLDSVRRQLGRRLREVRTHERYGSEQIQRDLKNVGHVTPLYRTLINMRAYDSGISYADLTVSTHPLITGPVEDLDINITPDTREAGGFHIELVGHPELYSQQILTRHAARLAAFISQLAASPETAIGAFPLTDQKELETIAQWASGPSVTMPPDTTTILDILHTRMPRNVPAILSDAHTSIGSDALGTRIAQIGRWLIAQDVGPGSIVAMALPRRIIAVEALFGILASGATLLPLDIAHPAERLRDMCIDAQAVMLLTLSDRLDGLNQGSEALQCPILCLDDPVIETQIATQDHHWITDEERLAPLTADHDAYVLYTSGSTGRPKGVLVPHRGLLNLLLAHDAGLFGTVRRHVGDRRVRAGHAMSMAFDTSWEQLIWLALGHELHLFDEETRRDPQALITELAAHKIDTLDVSPAMMQQMVAAGLLEQAHKLAMVQLGGEAVPPALWERLQSESEMLFYNLYGPTEYSVDALCAAITGTDEPVIGRPIANTHIQILDDRLCPVPIGVAGELYLTGPGLASGYLGQPALTAARFVADPNRPGERMYRSGDRACWTPDGTVSYLGRGDRQVKIRGHRVELGEVENSLATLPGIGGALVVAETGNGATRLLAWCISQHSDLSDRATSLLAALEQKLPPYMIPSALAVLDAWPQTINGKIDRSRLPSPRQRDTTQKRSREPGTDNERLLCTLMGKALGNIPVGPEDDFFMMGGDSITAMSLGTSLRREGWVLRPRDIFSLRRADRMAGILTAVPGVKTSHNAGVSAGVSEEGALGKIPIVSWFGERFGMECVFAHAVLMRVPAELNRAHLVSAVTTLLRVHPALRMQVEGGTLVIPPEDSSLAERCVTEIFFGAAEGDTPDEQTVAKSLEKACSDLDPAKGDLIRIVLSAEGHRRGWILVAIHHLAVDGVSWRVLLPQLQEACEAAIKGRPPVLVPEETGLRAWSLALPQEARKRRTELSYWQKTLETPTCSDGMLDPLHDRQGTAGHARLVMDPALTAEVLHSLPARCRASTESLLLTAVIQSLNAMFGATRMRVAMESHGRHLLTTDEGTALDPERTVGWLTAEYPILVESAETTPLAALRNTKDTLGRVPDRGLGYGLLRYVDPQTSPVLEAAEGQAPCSLLFNYLGRFQAGTEDFLPQRLGKILEDSFAVYCDPTSPLQYPLELNSFVDEADGVPRLALSWSWASTLYDRATIERLHAGARNWLRDLASNADAHPFEVSDTLVPSECGVSARSLEKLRTQFGPLLEALPLLPLHEGLIYHARLDAVGGHYTSVTRLFLEGPLDRARLQRALDRVLQVQTPLRARFQDTIEGHVIQVIPARKETWPFTFENLEGENLEGLSEEARDAAIETCEQRELALRFDPSQDLMVHARLVRLERQAHVLFLSTHHLISDGWSTPLIISALAQAYDTESLEEPATSYAQIVGELAARDPLPARAAWSSAMAGATPTLLFRDSPISETVTEHEICLDPALDTALEERCRVMGLTRNTLMQGLWAAALSILTGQQDIVFGTPVSGRFSDIEGLSTQIGLFSNTVPVRVRLEADQPLLAQLTPLQDMQGALLEHDGISLAEIQRLAGQGALFDTLLVSENYPDDETLESRDFAGVRFRSPRNRGYTHYPLTLMVVPGEETRLILECRVQELNGRAFNPDELLQRLCALLSHMAGPIDVPWGQIDPRLDHERDINDSANDTKTDIGDLTLQELVRRQVQKTPDAIALSDLNETLTYIEMQDRVRSLAATLNRAGAGPGTLVGIALPRSVTLTVALLATQEAGAAWLPLDTGYPDARLALMLDDARPCVVLTDSAHEARFGALMPCEKGTCPQGRLLVCDAEVLSDSGREQGNAGHSGLSTKPEAAAYLLYTSGSTGRPKGVLVSHQAIVNRLIWMQDTYRLTSADIVLQKTPSSFDVSIWEFFWPLISGAHLFMAPPEAHREPEALRALIEQHKISIIHFVPSMLTAFLDQIQISGVPGQCSSLRHIFCSGEALDALLARRCQTWLKAPLHNLYGPTEAAVDVTYFPAARVAHERSVPIGRPVWNTQLHILDSYLRPSPIGVTGELYLSGIQLAEGYFDRPDLTATRFVANPAGNGARMYRTGDLACWTGDGTVIYLGRTDNQIKLRGQRIELAEIEHALRELPGIAQASVSALALGTTSRTDLDSRQLVAHVLPDVDAQALDPAALRNCLSGTLPSHMVPAAIIVISHWPTGPSGKLDRSALPMPSLSETSEARAPRTTIEIIVAESCEALLGREVRSVDDDFFLLGGHSLLAMRLASLLRQKLEKPVSVGQIIAASTVGRLARALASERAPDPDASGMGEILTLRAAGTGGVVFCIHPASGYAWQYTGILSYLPAEMGLIGLQSPRPDGVIASCDTLEAACDRHLATIRRLQPHGPYRLIGYSLGGTMAHAIAAALRAEGESVELLALFDTYPPEGQDWTGPTQDEAEAEVERERLHFLEPGAEEDAEVVASRDAMFADIVANYADAVKLLSQARTTRFDGTVLLFAARIGMPDGWDPVTAWADQVKTLCCHDVHCAHEDSLSPQSLAVSGPILRQALEKRIAKIVT